MAHMMVNQFVNFMVVPRRWRPVAVALMTLVFNVVCSMTAFADETKLPPWFESARAKWAQLRAQAENPPRAAPQHPHSSPTPSPQKRKTTHKLTSYPSTAWGSSYVLSCVSALYQ